MKDLIIDITMILLSTIFALGVHFLLLIDSIPFDTFIFIVSALICLIVIIWVHLYYELKKIKNENNILLGKNGDLENEKSNLLSERDKLMSQQGICMPDNLGNKYFLMALALYTTSPLKISLLEKAIYEHKNVLAGLMLGNIYSAEIEKENQSSSKLPFDKAMNVYGKMVGIDDYGVSQWMLGWFYEKNLVSDAQKMTMEEREKKAREYYEISKSKGFPKAYNSIGNMMLHGMAQFDRYDDVAIERHYIMASEGGDYFAMLNLGHKYVEKYTEDNDIGHLEKAKDMYEKAAEMNCPEGQIRVSEVYLDFYIITQKTTFLEKAINNCVSAITHSNNAYTAAGYFLLGKIIEYNKSFLNDVEIRNLLPLEDGITAEEAINKLYSKAYMIFRKQVKKDIDSKTKKYYEDLRKKYGDFDIEQA